MRRTKLAAVAAASLVSAALALPLTSAQVGAAPAPRPGAGQDAPTNVSDNLTPKWRAKEDALRKAALEQQLRRGTRGGVEKLARGQYAKVAQTGTDRIFVVLAQFGNTRHSAYCDSTEADACAAPSDGTPQRYNGPRHNQIPEPDRSVDNRTLWKPDFNADYFRNMYFNRMRKFYEQQSMGRYSFEGQVTEWVRVPFNQARYGRNACGAVICSNAYFLVRDALAYWTQGQVDAGKTMPQIQRYLTKFDKQDRYDFDEDGDFAEPDGYIDHFQIVHAGGDEADGDPIYGSDAIWSHRSNAQIHPNGEGPVGGAQIGGVQVGEGGISDEGGADVLIPENETGIWVSDYTMQPENGGLSVFAHEFGHDLGLPDLYDTSGNTGGAENSTGFWTLMSQSRGTAPGDDAIGDRAMPFGAWEKFQLGWLDYESVQAGQDERIRLRPGQSLSDRAHNGAVVVLPDKQVQLALGDPCATCGERFYWSRQGNDLDNSMTTGVDGGGALTAQVKYSIEEGWDYAFLEATTDGGATWTPVATSESYSGSDESGLNPSGAGISGVSADWVELTATVPDGAQGIRWRYRTDPAVAEQGFQVDEITLDGTVIGDAETDDDGWTLDGFRRTTGSDTVPFLNAYFVDNRQYVGRDRLLTHLYNFLGFSDERSNKVGFFHYEPGALISYWDTSYTDNDVGDHPGHGEVLPVDARPEFDHYPTGDLARPRILTYDSTFSLEPSSDLHLRSLGEKYTVEGSAAVPTFDDTEQWWFPNDEHTVEGVHPGQYQPGYNSVDVPETGTVIKVRKVQADGDMIIKVTTSD